MIRLQLSSKEIKDLDDFCRTGIGLGASMGMNTYVLKKMRQFISNLPPGKAMQITEEEQDGQTPGCVVYFQNDAARGDETVAD